MRLAPKARLAAFAIAVATHALHAEAQSNLTSPNTLDRTLHILYIAAAVMGLVLLLVAALAYAIYRKNQHEALVPNDTDDSVK